MRRRNIKHSIVSLILCAAMSCVVGAVTLMSPFKAKADATPAYYTLEGFTIDETAAVRIKEPNGIRFTTELSGDTKTAIGNLGLSNVSYGTLLLPADFLGTEELTHGTAKVVDIPTTTWQDEAQTTYTSVLAGKAKGDGTYENLPETYYNRPIAARSYVTGTTKNNQQVTYYSTNTAVRSIGYVAYMAQLDGDNSSLIQDIVDKTEIKLVFTDEKISALQNSASGTTVVENKINQSTTVAATVTVGGIPVPADMVDAITYESDQTDVISVNGETLTAEKEGSATITASVKFGNKDLTATKEMSTDSYEAKSVYKILISEAAEAAQLNASTTYLPAQSKEAYDAYHLAYEKTAAYQLQSVLKEATGIELEIVTATGEEGVHYISVGQTSLVSSGYTNGLKDTEAKVQVVDGNVIICGGGQEGTLYGVQRWLYDAVGYEYYMNNTYVVNDKVEIVAFSEAKTYERDIAFNATQTDKLDYHAGSDALDGYGMRSYTEKIIPVGITEEQESNGHYYKGVAHNSVAVVTGNGAAKDQASTTVSASTGSVTKYTWSGSSGTPYKLSDEDYASKFDNGLTVADAYKDWYATYTKTFILTKKPLIGSATTTYPEAGEFYHVIENPNYNSEAAEGTFESYQYIKAELCYTAHGNTSTENGRPAMVEAVASAMFTQMQKFPLYDRIGFAQMDHSIWCECSSCKDHGNASANLLEFLLDVAQSLKTKLAAANDARAETFNICTLFYHKTNPNPIWEETTPTEKLSSYMKHIEVWFAETGADQIDPYNLAYSNTTAATISSMNNGNDWNTKVYGFMSEWSTLCKTYGSDMLWWGYYANTTSQFIPFNTIDAMRYNYKTASELGVDTMFNQMMTYQTNWSSLKYYLMSKLTVNAVPTNDEWNGWIDSYFQGAYGPGAEGMRAYFNSWYDLTNSDAVKNNFRRDSSYEAYQKDSKASKAAIGLEARGFDINVEYDSNSETYVGRILWNTTWDNVWTEVTLKNWIASCDAALGALDATDSKYETYYRNIMLEKLVPMYLLMIKYDRYTFKLKAMNTSGYFVLDYSQAGEFESDTYVKEYGAEFLTWVDELNITNDGEGRTLQPILDAIKDNGVSEFNPPVVVSDLIIAEKGKNVTLYSANLAQGDYKVSGTLTTATTATVSTNGQVTVAVGDLQVGDIYNVTFTDAKGNAVTFNNVVVATAAIAGDAGAAAGSNGYYVVDKTYYIEAGVADTWLTHDLFQKGTYTITVDGNSMESTVYYAGSLKITLGAMLNGEQRFVEVKDSNNNTYVFNVVAANYIRTVEELQELGVGGGMKGDHTSYTEDGVKYGNGNSGEKGKNRTGIYVLANDIDCSGYYMAAGYSHQKYWFKGTFDGNGHTISNVIVSEGGIFGGMQNATIKNVNFTNVRYHDNVNGAGQGYNNTKQWGQYFGLIGQIANNTTIENINVYVSEFNTYMASGLLVFRAQEGSINYFRNINVYANGLTLNETNVLATNYIEGTMVFEDVNITAAGYTYIALKGEKGSEVALTEWPEGVHFEISSNRFAITNTETTVGIGDTYTITTDKALTYSYALKEAVAGVSVSANGVVTVAGTVKVGTTFTVVVTEAAGWQDEITLTVIKASKTFDSVSTIETSVDTTITLPAGIEGTVLKVTIGDGFVAYDKIEGIGSIDGNVVTPNMMPVKREHLGKGLTFTIETVNAIYTGSVNVYTMIINNKEEFNNFERVAANNSVAAGYVIEEQKYAYLSGYFVLGNDIAYNDVWYPALGYAVNNPSGLGSIYSLCNASNDNVKGWIEQYGKDKVIAMNGWTDTATGGFHATLDGDGYTIEGMQTTGVYNGLSVLGGTNGVVKNISFTNVSVGNSSNLLFGFSRATIENVYIQVASMASGNASEGATTLIGYASNTGATLRNVIIDATNCDITGLTRAYFVSLGICSAEGVYVIGGGAGLAESTKDLATTPAAFWDKTANDTAAKFDSVAALLADGTHGAYVKNNFSSDFWTVDEANKIVCPNALYDEKLQESSKIELTETITIEQVSGSFEIHSEVEGTVTSVTVGSTTLTNINGRTVTLTATDLVKQADLGEGVAVTIVSDNGKTYVGYANVYTMIIDNKAELDSWQTVAADNSVKAGLVLEAQKKAVLSGYFVLGADIEYDATWSPILTYGNIWQTLDKTGSIGKTVVDEEDAIFEGWGTGNIAGFKGVFDGNGHYIAGMTTSGEYSGFIVTMGGGTIKNVAFTNATVGAAAGFVFNRGQGTLENVYVEVASIASGTQAGAYTVVLGGYQSGSVRTLRNIVVDMSKANLSGLNYATVANLAEFAAEGLYVIGADELTLSKQDFNTDAAASVFMHYSSGYDIAGSFATAADLLTDETHGAYVKDNFSSDFWTVTADNVVPNCLAGNINATNRVTVDLGYTVSGTAVTQAATTTVDLSEVADLISGQSVSISYNGNVIYEGTISGNSVTIDPTTITGGGDGEFVITYSNGKISLPVYLDDIIELNQANAGTRDKLKAILNSKLDGHFVLTSHLNMAGEYLKSIEVFTGILDGNGYGITNTYISVNGDTDGATTYSPNFIHTNEGTVKNIFFELTDFAWTNETYEPQGKYYGNGNQGIVAYNSGTIENVYVDVTLNWSSAFADNTLRGILTKQNNGTINNVIMKATLAEGKTVYDNTMAAITANNSGTITNAYVVTNGAKLVVADPVKSVVTIYDLPTATIDAWGDMWNTSAYTDLPVFGKGYIVDGSDTLVTYGGTGLDVPTYVGSPTEVGFADTDTVYAAPMASSWSNRIMIGGSKTADYLVFDFAVATVPGSFNVWVHRGKSIVGGHSYVVYTNGNTPAVNEGDKTNDVKTFYLVDENGNFVTSTISANTKYTMYVHLGGNVDVDGIMIGGDGCGTMYVANVRYADGREQVITKGGVTAKMPLYTGDVTELGFEKGTIVQQMVTQDLVAGSQWYQTNDSQFVGSAPNYHRQGDKAHIAADGTQKSISIDFVLSEAITSGGVFHVWGEGTANADFGDVNISSYTDSFSQGFKACIMDKSGNLVKSLQPNTVYTLVMYMPGATTYNVANIAASGMTTYFSLSSIRMGTVDPLKNNNNQVYPEYQGDVTALGFAEGTTVYTAVQDNRTDMWNPGTTLSLSMSAQSVFVTKAADEDYASIQFSISRAFTGTSAFFAWCTLADGTSPANGVGYLSVNGGFSVSATPIEGGTVVAFDLETGLKATSFVPGKAYEMRWYGDTAVTFKIGCCEQNGESITIYYANPSSGNDVETTGDVVYYDRNGKALDYYYGDVTKLGFAEGTAVYGKVEDNRTGAWSTDGDLGLKIQTQAVLLTKAADEDYASIQFSVSRTLTNAQYFFGWSYYATGNGPTGYMSNQCKIWGNSGAIDVKVFDLDGNEVSNIEAGKAYEMRWYGEDIISFLIGCCEPNGIVTYYANPSSGNEA